LNRKRRNGRWKCSSGGAGECGRKEGVESERKKDTLIPNCIEALKKWARPIKALFN